MDGCKHLNLKVRPLSLLSHKPGPLTLWTTTLTSKCAAHQSRSMPVLLCHRTMTTVHAQSAATFELPLTRPSLSQRTLKTLDVDSADPGHTKPAAVDGCKHLNLKVRPLSLLSHKPGPLTLWTTMPKYAEIKILQPINHEACLFCSVTGP